MHLDPLENSEGFHAKLGTVEVPSRPQGLASDSSGITTDQPQQRRPERKHSLAAINSISALLQAQRLGS